MRTTIFCAGLLLALQPLTGLDTSAGADPGNDPDRLGSAVVPIRQQITLRLDAREADFTGTVTVTLTVPRPTDHFRFHAEDMDLTGAAITGPGGDYQVTPASGAYGVVDAVTDRPLTPGEYTLTITFRNNFDTQAHGLYRLDVDGEGYSFTQFEADDAREAFPCWDEPAFKFPYQMTLIVPEEHLAVSNTPIANESSADGWRTVEFAETPPLPSYLLAIATGPLETVPISGMSVPGNVVCVKGQRALTNQAAQLAPPLLAELEKYFGSPYPFGKLDLIAVPEFWPGAMENPGAITFADRILLVDPDAVTSAQRRRLASVIAHECAHMWFGDVVTMEWWDDLWLNESFASWMGDKVTDRAYPEFRFPIAEVRSVNEAKISDAQLATHAMRRPVAASDNLIQSADVLAYNKGQGVLGMVEHWIGEDAFQTGVRAYMKKHAWGNARGEDLWTALSEASGEDVTGALTSFLEQPGLPLVSAEITPNRRIRLTQRRFLNYGQEAPEPQLWKVPVVLRYQDDDGIHTESVLLAQKEQSLPNPVSGQVAWMNVNVEERGFYRWSAPPSLMRPLAENAPELMSPRERVGFLTNLAALVDAGSLAGDEYLEILGRFSEDTEPQVILAILDGLAKVKTAFVPDEARELFGAYVRRTLRPALDRFGREKSPGEAETVSQIRPRLLGWLADDGLDPELRSYAVDLAGRFLADPESIDPSLAETSLNVMAQTGDRELFDDLRARFEAAQVPAERGRYLGALASFRDPELLKAALDYSLTGPLRPNEVLQIPRNVLGDADDTSRDLMWEWMTTHYTEIGNRVPPLYLVFMPGFAAGCDRERALKARAFFSEPEHNPAGTHKELAKTVEGVESCAGLRDREGPGVLDYLKQHMGME